MFNFGAKHRLAETLSGGALQPFTGVVAHDGWEPNKTFTAVTHGLCIAHRLGWLRKTTEKTPELGWANWMSEFLVGTHWRVPAAEARGGTGQHGR